MFKKIHSNRDPRDTLYSELKKEFSVYVHKGNGHFKNFLISYPRFIFGSMIALLLTSLIFAIIFHSKMLPPEKAALKSAVKVHPVNDGFDNIMAAGDALKQTIRLRREVDSITSKKHLSKSDSLSLLSDLDSLQHIRITLSH